jgi:hypothetical protein
VPLLNAAGANGNERRPDKGCTRDEPHAHVY